MKLPGNTKKQAGRISGGKFTQRLFSLLLLLVMFFDASPVAVLAESMGNPAEPVTTESAESSESVLAVDISEAKKIEITLPQELTQESTDYSMEGSVGSSGDVRATVTFDVSAGLPASITLTAEAVKDEEQYRDTALSMIEEAFANLQIAQAEAPLLRSMAMPMRKGARSLNMASPDAAAPETSSEPETIKRRETRLAGVFDLTILDGDTPLQPETPVTVTVEVDEPIPENSTVYAVHFTDGGVAESPIPATVKDGTMVSFPASGFSVYVIAYTVEIVEVVNNHAVISLNFTDYEPYPADGVDATFLYDTDECFISVGLEAVLSLAQADGVAAESTSLKGFEIDQKNLTVASFDGGVAFEEGEFVIVADGAIELTDGTKTLTVNINGLKAVKEQIMEAEGVSIEVLDGNVPLGSEAQYTAYTKEETVALVEQYKDLLGDGEVAGYSAADLKIVRNDKEVNAEGLFEVTLEKSSLVPEGMKLDKLFHIHGGRVEKLNVTETEEGYVFQVENFSEIVASYTVDFVASEVSAAWSWPGQGSYSIADILAEIGVSGTVESVTLERVEDQGCSEKALYLEEKEDGWYLVSEEAFFDTFELKIAADGVTFTFTVKDDVSVAYDSAAYSDYYDLAKHATGNTGSIHLSYNGTTNTTPIINGTQTTQTVNIDFNFTITDQDWLRAVRAKAFNDNTTINFEYDLTGTINDHDTLKVLEARSAELMGPDSMGKMGEFSVENGHIKMNLYTSKIDANVSTCTGSIPIRITIDGSTVIQQGNEDYHFPGTSDTLTINWPGTSHPTASKSVDHNWDTIYPGEPDDEYIYYRYTLTVKGGVGMDALVLTDYLPSGMELDGSMSISRITTTKQQQSTKTNGVWSNWTETDSTSASSTATVTPASNGAQVDVMNAFSPAVPDSVTDPVSNGDTNRTRTFTESLYTITYTGRILKSDARTQIANNNSQTIQLTNRALWNEGTNKQFDGGSTTVNIATGNLNPGTKVIEGVNSPTIQVPTVELLQIGEKKYTKLTYIVSINEPIDATSAVLTDVLSAYQQLYNADEAKLLVNNVEKGTVSLTASGTNANGKGGTISFDLTNALANLSPAQTFTKNTTYSLKYETLVEYPDDFNKAITNTTDWLINNVPVDGEDKTVEVKPLPYQPVNKYDKLTNNHVVGDGPWEIPWELYTRQLQDAKEVTVSDTFSSDQTVVTDSFIIWVGNDSYSIPANASYLHIDQTNHTFSIDFDDALKALVPGAVDPAFKANTDYKINYTTTTSRFDDAETAETEKSENTSVWTFDGTPMDRSDDVILVKDKYSAGYKLVKSEEGTANGNWTTDGEAWVESIKITDDKIDLSYKITLNQIIDGVTKAELTDTYSNEETVNFSTMKITVDGNEYTVPENLIQKNGKIFKVDFVQVMRQALNDPDYTLIQNKDYVLTYDTYIPLTNEIKAALKAKDENNNIIGLTVPNQQSWSFDGPNGPSEVPGNSSTEYTFKEKPYNGGDKTVAVYDTQSGAAMTHTDWINNGSMQVVLVDRVDNTLKYEISLTEHRNADSVVLHDTYSGSQTLDEGSITVSFPYNGSTVTIPITTSNGLTLGDHTFDINLTNALSSQGYTFTPEVTYVIRYETTAEAGNINGDDGHNNTATWTIDGENHEGGSTKTHLKQADYEPGTKEVSVREQVGYSGTDGSDWRDGNFDPSYQDQRRVHSNVVTDPPYHLDYTIKISETRSVDTALLTDLFYGSADQTLDTGSFTVLLPGQSTPTAIPADYIAQSSGGFTLRFTDFLESLNLTFEKNKQYEIHFTTTTNTYNNIRGNGDGADNKATWTLNGDSVDGGHTETHIKKATFIDKEYYNVTGLTDESLAVKNGDVSFEDLVKYVITVGGPNDDLRSFYLEDNMMNLQHIDTSKGIIVTDANGKKIADLTENATGGWNWGTLEQTIYNKYTTKIFYVYFPNTYFFTVPLTGPIHITYYAKAIDESNYVSTCGRSTTNVTNTVKSNEAQVTVQYPLTPGTATLDKSALDIDPSKLLHDNVTVSWQIVVTPSGNNTSLKGVWVADEPMRFCTTSLQDAINGVGTHDMTLVYDSVRVTYLNAGDGHAAGDPVPSSMWEVPSYQDGNQRKAAKIWVGDGVPQVYAVKFIEDIFEPVVVTFDTNGNGNGNNWYKVGQNVYFYNRAVLMDGSNYQHISEPDDATNLYEPHGEIQATKEFLTDRVNKETGEICWKITVNTTGTVTFRDLYVIEITATYWMEDGNVRTIATYEYDESKYSDVTVKDKNGNELEKDVDYVICTIDDQGYRKGIQFKHADIQGPVEIEVPMTVYGRSGSAGFADGKTTLKNTAVVGQGKSSQDVKAIGEVENYNLSVEKDFANDTRPTAPDFNQEVTYTVRVNANKSYLPEGVPTLIDVLPAGMEYVSGSLGLQAWGTHGSYASNWVEVNKQGSIWPDFNVNGRVLSLSFPTGFSFTGTELYLTYRARLTAEEKARLQSLGVNTAQVYDNVVTVTQSGLEAHDNAVWEYQWDQGLHKYDVTDEHYGNNEHGPYVYYKIEINPEERMLNGGVELVLTDRIETSMELVLADVTVTDKNGDPVTDAKISYDGITRVLTVRVPDGKKRVVNFYTKIENAQVNQPRTFTNTAVLTGETVFTDTQTVEHVVVTMSGTFEYTVNSGFIIRKVDGNNISQTLSGAEFTLYKAKFPAMNNVDYTSDYDAHPERYNLNDYVLQGQDPAFTPDVETTGSDGTVFFENLEMNTLYYWIETKTPGDDYSAGLFAEPQYLILYNKNDAASYNNAKMLDHLISDANGVIVNTAVQSYVWTANNNRLVNYKVTKRWSDGNNVENLRPSKVWVQLKQNGVNYDNSATADVNDGLVTIEPNNLGNWEYTWFDLPATDNNGYDYTYTAEELTPAQAQAAGLIDAAEAATLTAQMANYTTLYKEVTGGMEITNRLRDETTLIIQKDWNDQNNASYLRPGSIQVYLWRVTDGDINTKVCVGPVSADNNTIEVKSPDTPITLTAKNGWQAEFTGLVKVDGEHTYTYYLTEAAVDGYKPSYEITYQDGGTANANYIIHLTNNLDVVRATKRWLDTDGRETWTADVTFKLVKETALHEFVDVEKPLYFTENNLDWSQTITTTSTSRTAVWNHLDPLGEGESYFAVEWQITGVDESAITRDGRGAAQSFTLNGVHYDVSGGTSSNGVTVIVNAPRVTVDFTKTWTGVPDPSAYRIEVQLKRYLKSNGQLDASFNNEPAGGVFTLTGEPNTSSPIEAGKYEELAPTTENGKTTWHFRWSDLPIAGWTQEGGSVEYVYRVEELHVKDASGNTVDDSFIRLTGADYRSVENIYNEQSIPVTKKWADEPSGDWSITAALQSSERLYAVNGVVQATPGDWSDYSAVSPAKTVTISKSGSTVTGTVNDETATVTEDADNQKYTVTVTGLPMFRLDTTTNKLYQLRYSAEETAVTGYTTTVTVDETTGEITITNTEREEKKVNLTISKEWYLGSTSGQRITSLNNAKYGKTFKIYRTTTSLDSTATTNSSVVTVDVNDETVNLSGTTTVHPGDVLRLTISNASENIYLGVDWSDTDGNWKSSGASLTQTKISDTEYQVTVPANAASIHIGQWTVDKTSKPTVTVSVESSETTAKLMTKDQAAALITACDNVEEVQSISPVTLPTTGGAWTVTIELPGEDPVTLTEYHYFVVEQDAGADTAYAVTETTTGATTNTDWTVKNVEKVPEKTSVTVQKKWFIDGTEDNTGTHAPITFDLYRTTETITGTVNNANQGQPMTVSLTGSDHTSSVSPACIQCLPNDTIVITITSEATGVNGEYTHTFNGEITDGSKALIGYGEYWDKTNIRTIELTAPDNLSKLVFRSYNKASIQVTVRSANIPVITRSDLTTISSKEKVGTYTISSTDATPWTKTISNLLKYAEEGETQEYTYFAVEHVPAGYTDTYEIGTDGELTIKNNSTTTPGSLTIQKNVTDSSGTAANATGTFYFGVYNVQNPTDQTTRVATGSITLSNTSTGKTTVNNLPYGTYYVYELTGENGAPITDGLTTIGGHAYNVSGSGTAVTVNSTTGDANTADATITNAEPPTGSLTVSKTAQYDNSDPAKEFSFTVTLTNRTNIANETFGTADQANTADTLTFANGVATFILTNGQSLTINGLPAGTTYTVTETDYTSEGYTTTSTVTSTIDGETTHGTINAGETETVAFTNSKVTSIYARKVWTQNNETMTGWPTGKTVTFQLQYNNNGTWTEMTGTDAADQTITNTQTISSDQTVSFTDLPADKKYRIVEIAVDGTTLDTPITVPTSGTGTSADPYVFTNDIPLTEITVTKAWNAGGVTAWPDSIASVTVGLYQTVDSTTAPVADPDDSTKNYQKRITSETASYTVTFPDLPQYTDDGEAITYSVKEESVLPNGDGATTVTVNNNSFTIGTGANADQWQVSSTTTGNATTITNTKSNNSITVYKYWYNAYGTCESSVNQTVTAQLYKIPVNGSAAAFGEPITLTPGQPYTVAVDDDGASYYVQETDTFTGYVTRYSVTPMATSVDSSNVNDPFLGNTNPSQDTVSMGGTLYIMNTATKTGMQVVMHKKWIEFKDPGMTFYLGQLDGFTTNIADARKYMKLKVELYYDAETVGTNKTTVVSHEKVTNQEILLWEPNTSGHPFNTVQLSNNIVSGQPLYLNYIGDWEWGFRENSGSGQAGGAGNLPEYGYYNGQLVHYVYHFEEVAIYDGSSNWNNPEDVTTQWWKLWQNPIDGTREGTNVGYTRTNIENRPKNLPVEKKWYKEGTTNFIDTNLADAADYAALTSITVRLMVSFDATNSSNGTWYVGATKTLTKDGNWSDTFLDLEAIAAGVISNNNLTGVSKENAKFRIEEDWNEAYERGSMILVDADNDGEQEGILRNIVLPRGSIKVQKQWAVVDPDATAVLLKLRRIADNTVEAASVMNDVYANPTKYGLSTNDIYTEDTESYIKIAKDSNGVWPTTALTITNLLAKIRSSDDTRNLDCKYFVEEVGYIKTGVTGKQNLPAYWTEPVYSGGTTSSFGGADRNYAVPQAAGSETTLIVTNSLTPGSLTLTKQITSGNTEGGSFTFQVVLTLPEGVSIADSVLQLAAGNEGTLTFASNVTTNNITVVTLNVQINNASAGTPKSVTITGIPAGTTYTVEETGLTNGWYQTGLVYGDQVSDSTATPTINAGDTDEVTITNTKGISINVTKQWKVDENDKTFTGEKSISFTLYQVLTPVGGTALAPRVYTAYGTNGVGTVTYNPTNHVWNTVIIPNLPLQVTEPVTTGEREGETPTTVTYAASYYVVETDGATADAGYVLTTTYSNESGAVNPSATATDKVLSGAGTITIINTETPGVELPSTGGTGTLPYTLSGLTLLLGAALILFLRRKREQN